MRSIVWIGLALSAVTAPGCAMFGGGQPAADDKTKITETTPVSPDPIGSKPADPAPYKPVPVDQGPPPSYATPAPAPSVIPAPAPAPPAQPIPAPGVPGTYVVQRGDTLYLIASKVYFAQTKHDQNVGANRIYDANRAAIGANKDRLNVGTTLMIPAADSTATPTAYIPPEPTKSKKKKLPRQ